MAFWPAVVLASRRELPIAARAVLLGVAFVLVDLALLAQSRASLAALPLTAVAAFLLVPGRVRLLLTLVPVAAGVALTLGPMLDVFPALDDGAGRTAAEDAFRALGIGVVLVVLASAALAWTDRRVTIAAGTARRAELVFAVGAADSCLPVRSAPSSQSVTRSRARATPGTSSTPVTRKTSKGRISPGVVSAIIGPTTGE